MKRNIQSSILENSTVLHAFAASGVCFPAMFRPVRIRFREDRMYRQDEYGVVR